MDTNAGVNTSNQTGSTLIVIGVAGGSGKTTVVRRIVESMFSPSAGERCRQ